MSEKVFEFIGEMEARAKSRFNMNVIWLGDVMNVPGVDSNLERVPYYFYPFILPEKKKKLFFFFSQVNECLINNLCHANNNIKNKTFGKI